MKKQGWVKFYRQSIDSTTWKNPIIWAVWSWCLLKANHKKNKFPFNGKDIVVKKGEFITGINKAVRELPNISTQQYRTAIKYLKSTGRITSEATNQFTLISIVNWEEYQNDNKQTNKPITNKQQTDNKQITTNKNDKNVKKDKNDNSAGKPADNKNTNLNTSKIPEKKQTAIQENKQISEIINIFKKTNKAVEFGNITERKASVKLIQAYGFQETIKWAKFAVEVQDITIQENEFAPRITTPHFLWKKLTALKIHFNKFNKKSYEQSKPKIGKYSGLSKQTAG